MAGTEPAHQGRLALDEAIRSRDSAEAKLRDARHQIAALHGILDSMAAELARHKQQPADPDPVAVGRSCPGLPPMAVPLLVGRVAHVQGRLCTIRITENPTRVEIKPGYRFAVFDAHGFKGEAVVPDCDQDRGVAYCRLDGRAEEIRVDDHASTRGMN
jgi:hypothetical protein